MNRCINCGKAAVHNGCCQACGSAQMVMLPPKRTFTCMCNRGKMAIAVVGIHKDDQDISHYFCAECIPPAVAIELAKLVVAKGLLLNATQRHREAVEDLARSFYWRLGLEREPILLILQSILGLYYYKQERSVGEEGKI